MVPVNGQVLIEPILNSDIRDAAVMKRSGIYVPKPKNKLYDFEGAPVSGRIYALPHGYNGPLKVNDRVAFNDQKPRTIKYNGLRLFIVKSGAIGGIIDEAGND